VDYELTRLGRTLMEPVGALYEWATAHRTSIDAARARFDASDRVVKPVKAARR
jgi:DNA-binding HxlR family transcriptional regulator